jgi:voltage-gated potassium channel
MQSSMRTLFRGAIFFALTSIIGVVGYTLAGWDPLDAAYMTVITIFGVGFGEVRPLDNDPRLRVFTMFVIVAGCSSVIYFIGGFVQMIAEGEFNRVLGARRMTKGIEQLKNHVIMCGYGRVGQHLAQELRAAGQTFVIVDTDMERLREAEAEGYLVLVGDCTDENVLTLAGINRARVVASVLSSDAANVFLTLTARELNGEVEIIARAEAAVTQKKLFRSGANRVVLPTAIGATKIANLISRPSAESLLIDSAGREHLNEDLEAFGLKMQEFLVAAGSELIGRPISDAEMRGRGGVVIVAIRHADGTLDRSPDSDFLLAEGDTIFVLGHSDHVLSIARRASNERSTMTRTARM